VETVVKYLSLFCTLQIGNETDCISNDMGKDRAGAG
jgi:hypothetical protein